MKLGNVKTYYMTLFLMNLKIRRKELNNTHNVQDPFHFF